MAVSNMCPVVEMHQCSGLEASVEEVLVWRAVRLQLTGPEGREGVEGFDLKPSGPKKMGRI
jgi:hypothetical protein